jgi:hypothetical protein
VTEVKLPSACHTFRGRDVRLAADAGAPCKARAAGFGLAERGVMLARSPLLLLPSPAVPLPSHLFQITDIVPLPTHTRTFVRPSS